MHAKSFTKAHAGARKVLTQKANIFRIAQGESKLLWEFVIQFQKERMLLPTVPDEWAAEAFTKSLNPGSSDASKKLKESLPEFQETSWVDVHNRYESKIRIQDDHLDFLTPKDAAEVSGWWTGSSLIEELITAKITGHYKTRKRQVLGILPTPDFQNITSTSVIELVSAMRNIKEALFSNPMRSDLSQRDHYVWCEYHGTNGHRTRDYQHLCDEVATLLKNGHLREFLSDRAKNNYSRNRDNTEPKKSGEYPPRLMINMFFGGNEINGVAFSAAKKMKVSVTHTKRLGEVTKDDITFTEEDTDGLLLPHNDALVISLNVLDFKLNVFW
ncbi:uncharacterized protein [Nicotiana sylvestris]|uniref:Uncharacterized protein LOC104227883 n=1 Tax=Nicotiana sylvestris TaxID=4096 RepID=A0A1U7WF20_NICSY|nr:PREDICTED: uncharacterized protein LOC104227883 [Nicotiana sylvestris]